MTKDEGSLRSQASGEVMELPENWTTQLGWLFDVANYETYLKVVRLIQMWQGVRVGTEDEERSPKLAALKDQRRGYVRVERPAAASVDTRPWLQRQRLWRGRSGRIWRQESDAHPHLVRPEDNMAELEQLEDVARIDAPLVELTSPYEDEPFEVLPNTEQEAEK